MPSSKVRAPSIFEIRQSLQDALRRTAISPSILGYTPQEHQLPFHKSAKSGRLFLGGNRAGKTVGGGTESIWYLTGTHPYKETPKPPVRGRAIGVDFDDGINRIIKPEIARWIPPSFLKNGSWEDSYSKGEKTLTLVNGSTLEFMSYDQDVQKFAGTSRHFIWFDEEPPEDIFNENMLRLLDVDGDWWLTMTPLIDMSWTYDRLFQKALNGGFIVLPDGTKVSTLDIFQASVFDNKYINASTISILTEGLTEEEKLARTEGKYFSYTGAIYSKVTGPETFMSPIHLSERWPIFYEKWGHFGMLDHGYRNPTAFYLGCFDKDGRIIIYYEYYESNKLVKDNAIAIKMIIAELKLTNKLEYIIGDPSIWNVDAISGGSVGTEYADNGVYIGKANNDVTGGINRVSSRFKNSQLYITKNCEKAIWELARYRWEKYESSKTTNKNNLRETPMKKDDHAMDAIRYGVVSRPQLSNEKPLATGNIMQAPIAYVEGTYRDGEREFKKDEDKYFDEFLGTDW